MSRIAASVLLLFLVSGPAHAQRDPDLCDRRLVAAETEWRGNVAYPKRFGAKTVADILVEHQIIPLSDQHATLIFNALIAELREVDPSVIRTTVDVRWHAWFWTVAGRANQLDIWFTRDEDMRATRAFVRRRNYMQDLIVTTPARLAALEHLVRSTMLSGQVHIEDDPRVFDRLPAPTAGYLL